MKIGRKYLKGAEFLSRQLDLFAHAAQATIDQVAKVIAKMRRLMWPKKKTAQVRAVSLVLPCFDEEAERRACGAARA